MGHPSSTPLNLGQLKKKRDLMRAQLQKMTHKLAEEYELSQFQALHLITDALIEKMDNSYNPQYAQPWKLDLAQTYLPSTYVKAVLPPEEPVKKPAKATPDWAKEKVTLPDWGMYNIPVEWLESLKTPKAGDYIPKPAADTKPYIYEGGKIPAGLQVITFHINYKNVYVPVNTWLSGKFLYDYGLTHKVGLSVPHPAGFGGEYVWAHHLDLDAWKLAG